MEFLQDFDFVIQYIPGHMNIIANLLSHRPDFDGGRILNGPPSSRTTCSSNQFFSKKTMMTKGDASSKRYTMHQQEDTLESLTPGTSCDDTTKDPDSENSWKNMSKAAPPVKNLKP
jgi:hypothetical protein